MDYEKKYKEALGWMQSLYNGLHGKTKEEAEKYFPELKESEDERIRKRLIEFFEDWGETKSHCWGKSVNKILAWLEKQGEQKVPIDDFKAKNWYVSEVDGKIHDMTYNPADKVEPKFKVGDWIVNNEDGSIGQITDIIYDESGYGYNHTNGWLHSVFEKDFHLWTIDDAKDGDVLACGDKVYDCPFIFHNLTEDQNPRSYCGVNTLHHFQDNDENGGYWCYSDEVRPATKEQRDLLFAKMKEAGYQWNPDTKELKKVEQKPTWSDEDENVLEDIEEAIINYWHGDTQNILLDWLKSLKERLS